MNSLQISPPAAPRYTPVAPDDIDATPSDHSEIRPLHVPESNAQPTSAALADPKSVDLGRKSLRAFGTALAGIGGVLGGSTLGGMCGLFSGALIAVPVMAFASDVDAAVTKVLVWALRMGTVAGAASGGLLASTLTWQSMEPEKGEPDSRV